MRRPVSILSAALLLCGAASFFALSLATIPASGQVSNMNGNMVPSRNGLVYTNTNMNRAAAAPAPAEEPEPEEEDSEGPPPAPSLLWSPLDSVEGYTTATVLKIRGSADARSAVSEESGQLNYSGVEVFESARDFLRVSIETPAEGEKAARRIEGWAEWGAVLPYTTALVIDARGGEVLRRVPLGAGVNAVTFSPDGRRALFHGEGTTAIYEADATDFRLTRVLRAEGKGSFGHAAFDADGRNALVPFWASTPATDGDAQTTGLHLLRVGEGAGTSESGAQTPPEAERFVVSDDNRLGFAFYCSSHGDEYDETGRSPAPASVEVFDLGTMTSLRRFRLPGPGPRYEAGTMALSHDGSELYLLTDTEPQRLVVVDTRSGGLVREVPLGRKAAAQATFTQPSFAGSALLLRQWDVTPEGEGGWRGFWLAGDKLTPADEAFALAVEAGGTRYAVDEAGTQLFTLDANNRPRATRAISRPDLGQNDHAGQVPIGLFATPDGTRLILILAVPEDGC